MNNQKNPARGNFFKRNLGYFLLGFSLIVVATSITLALTLGNNATPPDDNTPVDNSPVTFAMPVDSYTLGDEAILTSHIWLETLGAWGTHNGIDFICAEGTQVKSVQDGTVASVVNSPLEGMVVVIEHGDGLVSIYKSLGEEVLVTQGQAVTKGQVIGTVSNTAIFEDHVGTHLHFEMKKDNLFVNPADYLEELAEK